MRIANFDDLVKRLQVNDDTFYFITGPSGAGKSTYAANAFKRAERDIRLVELDHYGEEVNSKWVCNIPKFLAECTKSVTLISGTCDNFIELVSHVAANVHAVVIFLIPDVACYKYAVKGKHDVAIKKGFNPKWIESWAKELEQKDSVLRAAFEKKANYLKERVVDECGCEFYVLENKYEIPDTPSKGWYKKGDEAQ